MKIVTTIIVLLGLGYTATRSDGAEGQPPPVSSLVEQRRQANRDARARELESRFDFSFPGGTSKEFANAINDAARKSIKEPEPVNVIIPPELNDVRIPPMELRSVDARSIFLSLNLIARQGANALEWIPVGVRGGADVWVPNRTSDNRKTQTFYVGNLLQKFKIEDITTAVQTTWDLGAKDGGPAKPELKYHRDTQLLIVRAYPAQLEAMEEVVTQLRLAVEPAGTRDPKVQNDKKVH